MSEQRKAQLAKWLKRPIKTKHGVTWKKGPEGETIAEPGETSKPYQRIKSDIAAQQKKIIAFPEHPEAVPPELYTQHEAWRGGVLPEQKKHTPVRGSSYEGSHDPGELWDPAKAKSPGIKSTAAALRHPRRREWTPEKVQENALIYRDPIATHEARVKAGITESQIRTRSGEGAPSGRFLPQGIDYQERLNAQAIRQHLAGKLKALRRDVISPARRWVQASHTDPGGWERFYQRSDRAARKNIEIARGSEFKKPVIDPGASVPIGGVKVHPSVLHRAHQELEGHVNTIAEGHKAKAAAIKQEVHDLAQARLSRSARGRNLQNSVKTAVGDIFTHTHGDLQHEVEKTRTRVHVGGTGAETKEKIIKEVKSNEAADVSGWTGKSQKWVKEKHKEFIHHSYMGETDAGASEIRRQVGPQFLKNIVSGQHEAPLPAASYPALKKLGKRVGIGAGAAGLAGAGAYALYRHQQKKKAMNFSADDDDNDRQAQIAALRRKLATARQQTETSTPAHDITTGAIEGGLGVLATDKLIHRIQPKGLPGKFLIGAGVGGAATGAIGYGLSRFLKKKDPNQAQFSSRLKPIQFGFSLANPLYKGEKVTAWNQNERGRREKVSISKIISAQPRLNPTIVKRYQKKPSEDLPQIYKMKDGKFLMHDGNHRVASALRSGKRKIVAEVKRLKELKSKLSSIQFARGEQTAKFLKLPSGKLPNFPRGSRNQQYTAHQLTYYRHHPDSPGFNRDRGVVLRKIRMREKGYPEERAYKPLSTLLTDKELKSKLRSIRFDDGSSTLYPPQKGKRLTVAQDRYRKAIHEQEIDRMEANLAKSGIAGAAVGGLLRGKVGAAVGAGSGLAVQAGLIARSHRKRDVYGDRPFYAKKEERLPWQVGTVAAGGLLARKLYKRFHSASTPIQFDQGRIKKEEGPWYGETIERLIKHPTSRVEAGQKWLGRAGRIRKDLARERTASGQIIDEKGRTKEPEWKKPWVKKAVGGAVAIGGLVALRHGAGRIKKDAAIAAGLMEKGVALSPGERFAMNLTEGNVGRAIKAKFKKKFPGLSSQAEKVGGVAGELRSARDRILGKVNKSVEGEVGQITGAKLKKNVKTGEFKIEVDNPAVAKENLEKIAKQQEAIEKRKEQLAGMKERVVEGTKTSTRSHLEEIVHPKPTKKMSSKQRLIHFQENGEVAVRPHTRRPRRRQRPDERKGNREGFLLGAGLGLGAAGTGYGLKRGYDWHAAKAAAHAKFTREVEEEITRRAAQAAKQAASHLHIASAKLDRLINFSSITYHETESEIHRRKAGVHSEKAGTGAKLAGLAAIGGAAAYRIPAARGAAYRGAGRAAWAIHPRLGKFVQETSLPIEKAAFLAPAAILGTYGAAHQIASWRQKSLANKDQKQAQVLRTERNRRIRTNGQLSSRLDNLIQFDDEGGPFTDVWSKDGGFRMRFTRDKQGGLVHHSTIMKNQDGKWVGRRAGNSQFQPVEIKTTLAR
jgi:hypothetical protein